MNRLAQETSPYLRQHAENPVDWYPWGPEAFALARETDRPILLSVGYSACHWCHVMAHESFENPEIAAVMNRLFVNVKVDREERPDVDAVYMDAVQALSGHGGWPMTMFLSPDGHPFYGGTYFPPEDRQSMPGFVRIMEAVADVWTNQRDDVADQTAKLQTAIEANTLRDRLTGDATDLQFAVLDRAYEGVREQFDPVEGGFGRAPKFPPAMTLDFLFRTHQRDNTSDALAMAITTLDAMAAGGIYDHVGGGFARYSTDSVWLVPHFEKMLYDQALLVGAYLRGYLLTGNERYREVVEETIAYVLRDLHHHDGGGFFSAEDADSEGIEGKFSLWSPAEIEAICGTDAAEVIRYFGVTESGNFTDPHTSYSGSILHQIDRHETRPDAVRRALPQLLAARNQRVRPGLDDKVLTAWNAMFTKSLIEAAAALDRADWMDAARTNVEFLLVELRPEGRLLRSWQADGGARHLAYAEDYAALIGALLSLAEHDDVRWLEPVLSLAHELRALFADDESGGFFTTGTDAEALIVRPQDFFDNATPSENSLAADALLRLAAVTGDLTWSENSERLLRFLGPAMTQYPTSFGMLLGAYERALTPAVEVAVVGPDRALSTVWARRVIANGVGVRSPDGTGAGLTPLLEARPFAGTTLAYVCENFACRTPVSEARELDELLDTVV